MPRVVIGSVGELLVEFVCAERDGRHRRAATYTGPFPSGAPGIFIDQAARVGRAAGAGAVFAGAVGDDAFGSVITDRLAEGGVDLRLVRVVPGVPTGSAFVSYNGDGSRDFVFNIAQSAAACFPDGAEAEAGLLAAGVSVLHISGSMLGDPGMRARAMDLCQRLKRAGVALSIDPNIRTELMADRGYLETVQAMIGMADHVLPSDADADLLFPGEAFEDWSARLLAQGARAVVLKRGDQGCIGRDAGGQVALPAHRVPVVDPTGAGDCFCATFVTLTALGQPLAEALARANAAGALAVGRLGPMEGNTTLAEIDAFLGAA
jgi:sugar/nucleoside kinase (ribokinase family)